ncbi:MAG: AAA family ATPase [Lachnospiraceae bacterium]|nr:AAA family ATPase [Lachnospiraceae bacterium]
MGNYLNPGNSGFLSIRNDTYMDKSGMIALINETINTPRRLTCVSRPRRFGKSFAAQMLCAYYDRSCDSSALFEDLEIAGNPKYIDSYQKHLNQYDVIYLDMTAVIGETSLKDLVAFIKRNVVAELKEAYPAVKVAEGFVSTLANTVKLTGNKMVMIIDEWDAPIREAKDDSGIQREYLEFLRALFKNSGATAKVFAAAYMTGILPIKKDGSQSSISDFKEFTIVNPGKLAEYVGFTEEEVRRLCEEADIDFSLMKQWYDGYTLEGKSIYNPNAVMEALRNRAFASYWTETSASKSLMEYISLDFDGLSKTMAELLGGVDVLVDTFGFANDLVTFRDKNDVLILLIHLGYLTYDKETETAHIPNEEIRLEFAKAIRRIKRNDTIRRVQESDQLILDTVQGNEAAVAEQIERIHGEETSPLFYNDEQALRSVVKLAYFSYRDHYIKFEELPSGDGYVDLVYLPKKLSPLPALVIELKWNQSAAGAIAQIKARRYPKVIQDYGGEILLVGISYDREAKGQKRKHTCIIERA